VASAGWVCLVAAVWLLYAAVGTLQYQLTASRVRDWPPFDAVYPFYAVTALLWLPVTLVCLWLAQRWPLGRTVGHVVPHLAALVVVAIGRALVVVTFYRLVGWYPPETPAGTALWWSSVLNNVVVFAVLTGLAHAVAYARVAATRERQFAEARIAALSAQIHPHFLFNSLNTIAAFVRRQPEQAEAMIVDLAALLRSTLDRDSSALISLREELETASAYLNIEARRFADRLEVSERVEPQVLDAAVPPFLLQPLLENAVRHGLAPKEGRSHLLVGARRTDDQVIVQVEDDGVGADLEAPAGLGTTHVRQRLQQQFGARASLTLSPRDGGGTVAELRLPYVRLPVAAAAS
jgi:two-component sensor histidine kinase